MKFKIRGHSLDGLLRISPDNDSELSRLGLLVHDHINKQLKIQHPTETQ